MRFIIPCLALTAVGACALPGKDKSDWSASWHHRDEDYGKCMNKKEATDAVEIYRQLIGIEYTADLANKWVSKDFVDNSDSINTFIHQKLGGPTFPSKAIFMAASAATPHFPMQILGIDAHQCNTVALRWSQTFGAANAPAKGITILKTVWEDNLWKIRQVDVEFNSLMYLVNLGGSYTWEGKTYSAGNMDPAL